MADMDLTRSDHIMFDNLPCDSKKVVVLGCGIPPANGIYVDSSSPRKSSRNDGPAGEAIYQKEAEWNGSPVTFFLEAAKSGNFYVHYKLCARQSDRTRVLYTSPIVTGGGMPEKGWEVEGEEEGIGGPPLFVGRIEGR